MDKARKILIDIVGGLTAVEKDTFAEPNIELDKFRQLLVSSEQIVIDAADQIVAALPLMHPHNIQQVLRAVSTLSHKLWYVRAECVAELLRREEPLPGGRARRAAPGEGRKEFLKEWAKNLGIGVTKLQEDIKIVEVFGTRMLPSTSTTLEPATEEHHKQMPVFMLSDADREQAEAHSPGFDQSINLAEDKEGEKYIQDVAIANSAGAILYGANFVPHPNLTRQHYVVLSKMSRRDDALRTLVEVIKTVEAGEVITAAELHKKFFVRSNLQGGFFEIRRDMKFLQTHIKFTMTAEDSELFKRVAELALDVQDFPLHKSISYLEFFGASGDGYKLLIKAFQAYLILLKSKYKKDWTIKRTLNPENFTDEISRKKMDTGHAQSKLTNQVRREKKRVAEALDKLEKTMPDGIDKEGDVWKSYEKQLIKLSRLEEAALSARDAYLSITMKNLNLSSEEQEEEKNRLLLKYRAVEELIGTKTPDAPPAKTKKPKQLKSKK